MKSVFWVGGFTGLSRILGLFREMLMSFVMGTGPITEAFIVAFKFPNFFRRFFAEGAFNAAFVPYLSKTLTQEGKENAQQVAHESFSCLALFMVCFVLFVEIFTPFLIKLIAPGYAGERLAFAIIFTRLTFPYIALVSLSALLAGILNALDRFKAAASAPLILNFWMIGALGWSIWRDGEAPGWLLSLSVTLAGITQFIWLWIQCKRHHFVPKFVSSFAHGRVVLVRMLPGMLGAGVTQANIFIDMILASFLPFGSMAYLYYADRLVQLPLSLIGVTLSTVMLPKLSKLFQTGESKKALNLQGDALFMGLLLSLPSASGLILLCHPIVSTIYAHGAFQGTEETAWALFAFSLGLPAYTTSKILSTTFFARGDTKTPVRLAMISILSNVILNLCFLSLFKHTGLALATSLSAWLYVALLVRALKGQFVFDKPLKVKKIILMTLVATMILGSVKYFFLHWSPFSQLIILGFLGVLIYGGLGIKLYKQRPDG